MSWPPRQSEFEFELATCAWAESEWPPGPERRPTLIARQLGWQQRRWDTIILEVDPVGLERRAQFGTDRLNSDLRHVLRNAPTDWTYYRDALPDPGYPWRYVREAIHDATDRNALESRKTGGRIEIRRIARYPNWVDRIVAIENKPDLDASAARRLSDQLEQDVAAGLADEVWLATARTDNPVEPALLERIPTEVGILSLGESDVDVLWQPRSLNPSEPGIDILERPGGGTHDRSAARFDVIAVDTKREKRFNIAERAYERGWRKYVDSMRPDCTNFEVDHGRYGYHPYCTAFERSQTPAECRGACEQFKPEPPRERQGGWPVSGGGGKAIRRVLNDRRERRRQSVSSTSTSERDTDSR